MEWSELIDEVCDGRQSLETERMERDLRGREAGPKPKSKVGTLISLIRSSEADDKADDKAEPQRRLEIKAPETSNRR